MKRTPWDLSVISRQLNRFSPEDDERCALVLRERDASYRLSLIELPNRHPEPCNAFRIVDSDVWNAMNRVDETRYELYGYLHTHPGYHRVDRDPSEADYRRARITPKHFLWFPAHRFFTWYGALKIYYQTHIPRKVA